MTTTQNITISGIASKDLARGVERLRAVEIEGEYRYFADETKLYYVVSDGAVTDLGRMLREGIADAYSLWCASTDSEELSRYVLSVYEGNDASGAGGYDPIVNRDDLDGLEDLESVLGDVMDGLEPGTVISWRVEDRDGNYEDSGMCVVPEPERD